MLSLIFGYAGTLTSIVSMQLKRKKHILLSQVFANGFGALSYLFLGGDSMMAGTGMVLGTIQCLVNYVYTPKGKLLPKLIPCFFLLMSALNSAAHISASGIFHFPVDLIPVSCSLLFVIGVNMKKATATRLFFLENSSLWIVYDLMVRPIAQANLMTHIVVVLSVVVGIVMKITVQLRKKRKKPLYEVQGKLYSRSGKCWGLPTEVLQFLKIMVYLFLCIKLVIVIIT